MEILPAWSSQPIQETRARFLKRADFSCDEIFIHDPFPVFSQQAEWTDNVSFVHQDERNSKGSGEK